MAQLPTTLDSLLDRVEKHLGINRSEVAFSHKLKDKIADLKPMWPVLFPEVSRVHEFVGFADLDIVFGKVKRSRGCLCRVFFPTPSPVYRTFQVT